VHPQTQPTSTNVDPDEGDFSFILASNKEYEKGCQNLENCGVIILYLLRHMPDEETFNKWCLLNWEVIRVSLNSYWGLGYKYVCPKFNNESIA